MIKRYTKDWVSLSLFSPPRKAGTNLTKVFDALGLPMPKAEHYDYFSGPGHSLIPLLYAGLMIRIGEKQPVKSDLLIKPIVSIHLSKEEVFEIIPIAHQRSSNIDIVQNTLCIKFLMSGLVFEDADPRNIGYLVSPHKNKDGIRTEYSVAIDRGYDAVMPITHRVVRGWVSKTYSEAGLDQNQISNPQNTGKQEQLLPELYAAGRVIEKAYRAGHCDPSLMNKLLRIGMVLKAEGRLGDLAVNARHEITAARIWAIGDTYQQSVRQNFNIG